MRDTRKVRFVLIAALVALAASDPDSPRWPAAAPAAVEHLLMANPWFLGVWVQALRPVRGALLRPEQRLLYDEWVRKRDLQREQRLKAGTHPAERS